MIYLNENVGIIINNIRIFDDALTIREKVDRFNDFLSERNPYILGINETQLKHIFPLGRTVGVALLGVIGVTALVVGVVFMNIPIGLYGTCTGAIIIATDILAIVLLVRKYYKDKDLLNSILEQRCDRNATNRGNHDYHVYSEFDLWNRKLIELCESPNNRNNYSFNYNIINYHFEALRDGRKYSVEISKPAFSSKTVMTISL